MSRKSENSAAGSAGDAESMLSSRESSPRKVAEIGAKGPFGDFSTDYSSCFILKINDEWLSTEEEDDEESGALRKEYLHRLKMIREKLAGIDIANKNYYNNCFAYPPHGTDQSRITEIFDSDENTKNSTNGNESSVKFSEEFVPVENALCENQPLETLKESSICPADSNLIQNSSANFKSKTVTNLDQDAVENIQRDLEVSTPPPLTDTLKKSELDIKSIFSYDRLLKHNEYSASELVDLNYNPPKKKPCVRESTPKLIISDGAIPLPYHIRVSLHEDISKAVKQASNECNLHKGLQGKVDHCVEKVKVEEEIKDRDCFSENLQLNVLPNNTKTSIEEFTENSQNVVQNSSKKSTGNDNTYVLFLDPLTQSSSVSPKSNVTVVTESTATVESPSRQPKKRRIFLRTARNKVKPMDSLSIWEEIRTMDAVRKNKHLESASSKETLFENILIDKVAKDAEIIASSPGGLDVPRKSSLTFKNAIRFPSITKISKFCSSAFGIKSEKVVESKTKDLNLQKGDVRQVSAPKVANTLLNLKQEQDVNLDNQDCTPPYEMHSEFDYTNSDEDIDAYYQPFCLFCFCF